jgi:hypothetical protein
MVDPFISCAAPCFWWCGASAKKAKSYASWKVKGAIKRFGIKNEIPCNEYLRPGYRSACQRGAGSAERKGFGYRITQNGSFRRSPGWNSGSVPFGRISVGTKKTKLEDIHLKSEGDEK